MPRSRRRTASGAGVPEQNPWSSGDSDDGNYYRYSHGRGGHNSQRVQRSNSQTNNRGTNGGGNPTSPNVQRHGQVASPQTGSAAGPSTPASTTSTPGKSKQGKGSRKQKQKQQKGRGSAPTTSGSWQFDYESGWWTQNTASFQAPAQPIVDTLTVVTYNVLFDYYDADKLYTDDRHRELCRLLRDEAPDVVCLQEVTPAFLDRLLNLPWIQEHYDVSDAKGQSVSHHGQVIMTQRRLRKIEVVKLSNFKRLVIGAIDLGDGRMCACGVLHLKAHEGHERTRLQQVDMCFAMVSQFAKRYHCQTQMLVGDFNFGDGEVENVALRAGAGGSFIDVWPEVHWCDECKEDLGVVNVVDSVNRLLDDIQKGSASGGYDARACTALLLQQDNVLKQAVKLHPQGCAVSACEECDRGFTVDPTRNDLVTHMFPNCPQLRLDRILVHRQGVLRPRRAGMIGTQMIFHGVHWPIWRSDHFGVLVEFDVEGA